VDEAGIFHKIPRIDDSRLAELFGREVLADLVRKELLSPEWTERILSWRHTGFSVHSLASPGPLALRMVEDKLRRIPSKGWAEMIRKVYEVDPMLCPRSSDGRRGLD
jgi:hypothetical protein